MDYILAVAGLAELVIILKLLFLRRTLRPLDCICGHGNHQHDGGHGPCQVAFGVSEKFPKGSSCACDIFIAKPPQPKDKGARELEKMMGL